MIFFFLAFIFSSLASTDAPPNPSILALDRLPDLVEQADFSLLEPTEDISSYIPISGPWKLVLVSSGVRYWEAPLPVRPRSLFFYSPPSGMKLKHRNSEEAAWKSSRSVPHKFRRSNQQPKGSWSFSTDSVLVRRPAKSGPPQPWEYAISYKKAVDREADLKLNSLPRTAVEALSKETQSVIFRSIQVDDEMRHGLYLPAPSTLTYRVTVPSDAVFSADLRLIPPEAADPILKSNGAKLRIWIKSGSNGEELVLEEAASSDQFQPIKLNLSKYTGQEILLRFETDPQGDPLLDYLFIAEPTLYTPQKNPERILLVFIDTLRQDTMSLYGYERQTTPKLDAWAKDAAIFTQARSVAPWTLPSARTMMTGVVPERWGSVPTLQDQFAQAGWSTVFLAGNIYLSSTFEIANGWGTHKCVNWPLAEVQIERAHKYLERNQDRPVLMMLHFMDMHLPYTEPMSYKDTFVDTFPPEADLLKSENFNRSTVLKVMKLSDVDGQARLKQYIRDRYDNNMRYIDDQLTPFLKEQEAKSPTKVFIFADHGEEFWDHNDFEHGHSFHDEVVKIPFIYKGSDLKPGTYDNPISLLDLAPSVAQAANINIEPVEGWPIQEIDQHDFFSRPQAIGRVLYGFDGWASIYQNGKYITRAGKERYFELDKDAKELKNNPSEENILRGRVSLQEALQTPVKEGFRIYASSGKGSIFANITLPNGLEKAWQGSDPIQRAGHTLEEKEGSFTAYWHPNQSRQREVFFIPEGNPFEALQNMQFTVTDKAKSKKQSVAKRTSIKKWPPSKGKSLMRASHNGRSLYLTSAVMPLPKTDEQLDAFDEEVSEELKVLGYLEE
ncbi:MAG: hypothetical protein CMK59_02985 [Proteobacteria bacterium]|nr:hypothetical protein [Pseudomonadota bacterium]